MLHKPYMSPKEYAAYKGVHRITIMRWIKAGILKVEQPAGKGGRVLIPVS